MRNLARAHSGRIMAQLPKGVVLTQKSVRHFADAGRLVFILYEFDFKMAEGRGLNLYIYPRLIYIDLFIYIYL